METNSSGLIPESIESLLDAYCPENATVFDPFAGVASRNAEKCLATKSTRNSSLKMHGSKLAAMQRVPLPNATDLGHWHSNLGGSLHPIGNLEGITTDNTDEH